MSQHDPADCYWCTRHAIGVGIGNPQQDPKYLCAECLPIMEYIKSIRRRTPYEIKARQGGVEAAGPLVEEFGSDLAEWTEEQVDRFVAAIWQGCVDEMRRLVRSDDAPF